MPAAIFSLTPPESFGLPELSDNDCVGFGSLLNVSSPASMNFSRAADSWSLRKPTVASIMTSFSIETSRWASVYSSISTAVGLSSHFSFFFSYSEMHVQSLGDVLPSGESAWAIHCVQAPDPMMSLYLPLGQLEQLPAAEFPQSLGQLESG